MTIETRMSHPEGGTECPPDESPVPAPPSSTATSTPVPTEICSRSTCDDDTPSNNQTSPIIVSNKVKVSPSTQKCKLRSQKCLPLQVGVKPNNESSDENLNNDDIGKDEECTNCTPSLGNVKTDLKKSIRMKPVVGGDRSKEEAKSRKSMRLRLRRGNNSDDPFGPKERPRYVEDLTEIDFDDDMLKVKFMDALGMAPCVKKAKMDPPHSPDSTSTFESNKGSGEKVIDALTISAVLVNYDNSRCEAVPKNIGADCNNGGEMDATQSPFQSVSVTTVRNKRTDTTVCLNDDEGWENWLNRLQSLPHVKKAEDCSKRPKTVPTAKEINESLIRLFAIGTTVKIVKSGIS